MASEDQSAIATLRSRLRVAFLGGLATPRTHAP
jgi:hypothetical protein